MTLSEPPTVVRTAATARERTKPLDRVRLLREAALRPGVWIRPVEAGFSRHLDRLAGPEGEGFEVLADDTGWVIRYVGSKRLADLHAQADASGVWVELPFEWLRVRDIKAGLFGFAAGKYMVCDSDSGGVWVRVRVREEETK